MIGRTHSNLISRWEVYYRDQLRQLWRQLGATNGNWFSSPRTNTTQTRLSLIRCSNCLIEQQSFPFSIIAANKLMSTLRAATARFPLSLGSVVACHSPRRQLYTSSPLICENVRPMHAKQQCALSWQNLFRKSHSETSTNFIFHHRICMQDS